MGRLYYDRGQPRQRASEIGLGPADAVELGLMRLASLRKSHEWRTAGRTNSALAGERPSKTHSHAHDEEGDDSSACRSSICRKARAKTSLMLSLRGQ